MADSSQYQNVTPMHCGDAPTNLTPAQRGRLLQDARDVFVRCLAGSMTGMMDTVDDTLFEMADKSENNSLQSAYFDAMREIRIKRPAIENAFKQKLLAAFHNPDARRPAAAGLNLLDPGDLELALVEDDTLETSIAIENMEQKIDNSCKHELYALDKRIALLLDQSAEGDDFTNPMGAHAIAMGIEEAVGKIESGVKIRLIVLKLFDKHVVAELNNIYSQINQQLIKHQVLPNIRTRVKHSGASRGRITVSETHDGIEVAAEGNLFDTLQQLLTVGSLAMPAVAPAAGQGGAAAAPAAAAADVRRGSPPAMLPAPTVSVVHNLTALQQGNTAALAGQTGIDPGALASGTVNVLRDLKNTAALGNMDHASQMTFDIVAMLFDYILDDKDIPDKMKALIGRLQIPLVKVAIMDKEFFARKAHPARRLLNVLAQAAVGWIEEQGDQDPLYRAINSVVLKIINEFDDNIRLFAKLLERFESFLEEQDRQADVRANRTARVIQGRERLGLAKTKAQNEITRRTRKRDIAPVVLDFLHGHWRNLLISAYLEGGEACETWTAGIETMTDLIWSVIPKRGSRDRQKLHAMLPGLVKRLRQGMEHISMEMVDRRRFLADLANCHADVVRAGSRAPAPASRQPEAERERDLTRMVLGAGRSAARGEPAARSGAPVAAADNLLKFPTPARPASDELPSMPEGLEQGGAAEPEAEAEAEAPPWCAKDVEDQPVAGPPRRQVGEAGTLSDALRAHLVNHPDEVIIAPDHDDFVHFEEDERVFDVDDEDGFTIVADTTYREHPVSPQELEAIAEHADPELKELLESGEFELEEIALADGSVEFDAVEEEDQFTEIARSLQKGTWIEFHEPDGGSRRARLTWVSPVTNVFLFTDRNGLKSGDRTLNGLAADFRRGSAKVIEDIPLFDRAVSRLLDGLGQKAAAG